MFNFLRMDFYRMLHSKITWVFLGIIVFLVIGSTALTSYISSDPSLNGLGTPQDAAVQSNAPSADSGSTDSGPKVSVGVVEPIPSSLGTVLSYLGGGFLAGGSLSILLMLYVALFLANEFESGFIKNVFTARTNRLIFFASKAIFMLVLTVLFSAFAFLLSYGAAVVSGLTLEMVPFIDIAIWFLLVVLVLFALEMLVAFIIWLTRSKVLGILVAVFVGGSLLYQVAGMVFQLVPALSNVPNYLLTGCLHSLAEATGIAGPLGIPHVLGVATAYLVVFAVASAVALKKKDV